MVYPFEYKDFVYPFEYKDVARRQQMATKSHYATGRRAHNRLSESRQIKMANKKQTKGKHCPSQIARRKRKQNEDWAAARKVPDEF